MTLSELLRGLYFVFVTHRKRGGGFSLGRLKDGRYLSIYKSSMRFYFLTEWDFKQYFYCSTESNRTLRRWVAKILLKPIILNKNGELYDEKRYTR